MQKSPNFEIHSFYNICMPNNLIETPKNVGPCPRPSRLLIRGMNTICANLENGPKIHRFIQLDGVDAQLSSN